MRSIKIKETEYSYQAGYSNDPGMNVLAEWLTDDVSSSVQRWERWIKDDSEDMQSTSSNATWLDKDGDNIILGSIMDLNQYGSSSIPEQNMISIPKENVLVLIERWGEFCNHGFEEVIIIEENGVYRMEEVQ